MGNAQKILMTVLWGVLVLMMLSVITLRFKGGARASDDSPVRVSARTIPSPPSVSEASLPVLFRAPSFALTDQSGKAFSDRDLAGHVYAIDFVFTHCAGPCPLMTARMAEFQKRATNPAVHLVSVSVDPENDTPERLKEYAASFSADDSRWHFLTGKKSDVFNTVRGFNLSAKPADGEYSIMHDERILLVDQTGNVRGIYHFGDPESMHKLVADATTLAGNAPATAPSTAPAVEGNRQP